MSPEALIAILGMAAVTLAVKAGGLLLATRLPTDGFAAAWLRHMPGAVLASLVAPAVANGGPAEAIAAIATVLAYVVSRSVLAAMIAGVCVAYVARMLF